MTWLLVALGAAVGAPARYLADRAVQGRVPGDRPWGTVVVNVVGSLLLGVVASSAGGAGWAALLGTGFCGALTTYSTFGYETVRLAASDDAQGAAVNVGVSIVAGVAAAALGWAAGTVLFG